MSMYGVAYRPLDASAEATGQDRTKQSSKDECDVNLIMARYVKTGMLSHLAAGVPHFADVSEVADYRTAIDVVRGAEGFFAQLPAEVRAHFQNDVAEFVDFVSDPANADRLAEVGLAALDRRVKAPAEEPVVEEPPPEVEAPGTVST